LKAPDLLQGEDVAAEPRQARSLAGRERLKTAALAMFGERGYQGTTVAGIARKARLPVGAFYQHYRSKRQLLLALMSELLGALSRLEFRPQNTDPVSALRSLLTEAFAHDLRYLGAYRAWEEAILSDPDLLEKERAIRTWTTARVASVLRALLALPGARAGVDENALAKIMDRLFWNLLADAARGSQRPDEESLAAVLHILDLALYRDAGTAPSGTP
jgi:AcrR family transcriptional regulator